MKAKRHAVRTFIDRLAD